MTAAEVVRRLDRVPARDADPRRVAPVHLEHGLPGRDHRPAARRPTASMEMLDALPGRHGPPVPRLHPHDVRAEHRRTAASKINMIPDMVELEVDIRTLPGPDRRGHRRRMLADGARRPGRPGRGRASIAATTVERVAHRHAAVGHAQPGDAALLRGQRRRCPYLTVGATDARFFRRQGITSYGYGMFSEKMTFEDYGSMFHGDDERIDVESLRPVGRAVGPRRPRPARLTGCVDCAYDAARDPGRAVRLRRGHPLVALRGLRRATSASTTCPTGFLRRVNATEPRHQRLGPARAQRGRPRRVRRAVRRRVDGARPRGRRPRRARRCCRGEIRPAMVEAVRRCSERLITGLLTNNFVAADGQGMQDGAAGRGAGAVRRRHRVEPGRRAQARSAASTRSPATTLGIEPPRRCSSTTSA